jgi:hypothetical protein
MTTILYVDCAPGINPEQLETAFKAAAIPFDSLTMGTRRSRWVEEMTERVRHETVDDLDPETGEVVGKRRVEVSREFVKTGRELMLTERDKPYAIGLVGTGEEHRAAVEAIMAAHVPFHGHAAKKTAEVKREANRRIEAVAPVWKQLNAVRAAKPNDPLFAAVDAIRAASDAIEARLKGMTDAEAGAFDVATAVEWP